MTAFHWSPDSRVEPLQSVKSGKVAGGSNPRVVFGCPFPSGPWHPAQAASKISLPVAKFKSFALCEKLGEVVNRASASQPKGRRVRIETTKRSSDKRSPEFMNGKSVAIQS